MQFLLIPPNSIAILVTLRNRREIQRQQKLATLFGIQLSLSLKNSLSDVHQNNIMMSRLCFADESSEIAGIPEYTEIE
jgi:hypothetical protein